MSQRGQIVTRRPEIRDCTQRRKLGESKVEANQMGHKSERRGGGGGRGKRDKTRGVIVERRP